MNQIYNILEQIKNDSSKTGKENILKANKDNTLLQETLRFLFDDLIVTGLSKKKMSKRVMSNFTNLPELNSLEDLFNYLRKNNSGKDKDIKVIQNYINKIKKEYGNEVALFVEGVATKDYPVGISKVTVNKVFGKNFIFKFDVRKGSKFEGKLKQGIDYVSTIKYDGIRSVFMVDENGVQVLGRSGKNIEGLIVLEAAMISHYAITNQPMMYDGELLAFNPDILSSDELFKVTSGKLRRDGNKEDIQFVMFDCMPLDEFKEGKSKLQWVDRRKQVEYLSKELNVMCQTIKGMENEYIACPQILYKGRDLNEIEKTQKQVEEQGFEGTMLDETTAYYEAKRTKSLLKYKTFHTVDLRVLRVEEHTRGNKLGSIVVDYKGHELGVGSGFTDKDREYFWNNQYEILGKIVEIGYFEESTNDRGGKSLRFPTFKIVRDKDEVSYE